MNFTHARTLTPRAGGLHLALPAVFGLALLAAPNAAHAQNLVATTSANTFVSITNPTIVANTGVDDGQANVTTPFPISYYGNTYTNMSLGYNGAILFPSGQFVSLGNASPNSASSPNNWVAPWWDDLRVYDAAGWIGHETSGTAPNRTFTVEWHNISRFGAAGVLWSMQVRFFESGFPTVQVDYGPVTGTATFSATAAMEDSAGANAVFFHSSNCTTSCNITHLQSLANMRVTVGVPPEPELTGSFGAFPRGLTPGTSGSGMVTLTNVGTNTATGVTNNIWLSADNVLDAADTMVGGFVSDIVFGDTVVTASISVPAATPVADYFVILEVDANDDWTELDETDNVIVAAQRFATSFDVQATAVRVTNIGGVNAGDTINFEIDIQNNGIPFAGALEVELFASIDQLIDGTDPVIGTVSVNVLGSANSETITASGTMPTLTPGAYYPGARLDPLNRVVESNENNNQSLGTVTFDTGPDFAVGSVVIPGSVVPGTTVNVATTINSIAVPFTGNVPYRLYASIDDVLDATVDIDMGLYNAAMAGETMLTDTEAVLFPTAMAPGRYYIIAVVDPMNAITEVTIANNTGVSATQIYNAFDFWAEGVSSAPTALEIGDILTVMATARNTGLPFTGNVPYSVYVSPDPVWDPGDQSIYDGLVFYPGTDTAAINVAIPLRALPGDPQVRPGGYTIIVRIDSTNRHAEADEDNNWGAGGRITLEGADLIPLNITAQGTAFIGLPLQVNVEFENQGVADARGFNYSYFLSENDIIRVNDTRIFTSASATIAAGGTGQFEDFVTLPAFTSTSCMWLGVIINDNGRVAETNINNNTRRIFDCINIVFPIPDMTVQIIDTPTVAASGEEFAVTRLLNNIGVADAPAFDYTYYLSSNPTISDDDIPIGTFSGAVAAGADDYGIDILQIPSQVAEGSYYLGIIVDPANTVMEVDETNNVAVGPQIPVFGATIRFTTDNLPNATVGVSYNVGVYAAGGPLAITWSVSRGSLPDGLSIDTDSGIISGLPSAEGLFEFVLRASAGTAFAEKPFAIRVTAPTVTLRVATPSLPTAIAGREYSSQLIAVGGQVPYTWAAVSDLPTGMELSESGLLSGIPQTPGALPITVRVRDALDNAASRELVLNVINANQSLQVVQIPLPTAVVDTPYCEPESIRFEAQNGTPPYTWSLVGEAPAGMTVSAIGDLCGTPEVVGRFPVTVRVQDATGLFDTSLFIFEVDDGTSLAVSTFSLEDAKEGVAYEATITAIRGSEPYVWSLVDGTGDLPAGMSLSADGVLSGTPSEAGTFAFVVQVIDAQLRLDVQPLSLTVEPKPVVNMMDDGGCTCVTEENEEEQPWGSMAALLGMGGFLMLRRRRRTNRLLQGLTILGTLVVFSSTAVAQVVPVPGTPYQRGEEVITYAPLSNPTIITTDVDDGQANVTLPFPFNFYDGPETSISLGYNGAILFPSGQFVSLGNATPGSTGSPNGWISPFWDDLRLYSANSGHIATKLEGTAPARTFSIEWHNISRFGSTGVTFSMRIVLHEGPAARFDIEYGPMNGSASFSSTMAAEDNAGGRPMLFAASNCTTTCSATDYGTLANKRIIYVQDPGVELAAVDVIAPEFAFLGAQTPIRATVQNLHGNPLGPFTVEIVAADNQMMMNPVSIGTGVISLQPFQSQTVAITSVFPSSLGQTRVWLGVNVDSTNQIAEVNENNNSERSATSTRLLLGAPDISAERVRVSANSVTAGSTIDVFSRLTNVGGEVATNVEVGVMLSSNPVISRQDVQLGTYTVTLQPGQTANSTTTVTIPAGTNSGAYYLGVVADPNNVIMELNESNNGRATFGTISVAGGALAVTTGALPTGYVFEPYVGLLIASGATPPYTWEITSGTLPDGLGLVPSTGELFGRPAAQETQSFTVRVTSSDNQEATKMLSITISDPSEPLTIVTRAVPAAVVGQEYAFPIVVTGGADTSSLSWSATGLPASFSVTDSGVLAGNPTEAGSHDVTLMVSGGGETASRDVVLEIKENATLLIVPKVLSTAKYDELYTEQLEATGGIPPITWLVQVGNLPRGITLSPTGEISGTPQQVGQFRFVVEARDAASGGLAAKDVNTFEMTVTDGPGFSIVTTSLPVGYVDEGYDESIAATGGLPPYDWTVVEGRLPEGVLSSVDQNTNEFRIAGQPGEPGTSNLLLKATDARGRTTERAFTLRVQATRPVVVDPLPVDDGGCTCVTDEDRSAPAGLLMVFMAGVFVFVRRRR